MDRAKKLIAYLCAINNDARQKAYIDYVADSAEWKKLMRDAMTKDDKQTLTLAEAGQNLHDAASDALAPLRAVAERMLIAMKSFLEDMQAIEEKRKRIRRKK